MNHRYCKEDYASSIKNDDLRNIVIFLEWLTYSNMITGEYKKVSFYASTVLFLTIYKASTTLDCE